MGAFLSGSFILDSQFFWLIAGMSALYVSGMFLNDVFDIEFDRQYRPERPIASGQIPMRTAVICSALIMLMGLLFILLASSGRTGTVGFLTALCLSLLIIIYNWKHKNNPFAPIIMGACRGMVPITAGLVYSASIGSQLIIGVFSVSVWTIGLTLLAKNEHLNDKSHKWPLLLLLLPLVFIATGTITSGLVAWLFFGLFAIVIIHIVSSIFFRESISKKQLVSLLIASFSLIDGLLLAVNGFEIAAILAGFMTPITLRLQKSIAGT